MTDSMLTIQNGGATLSLSGSGPNRNRNPRLVVGGGPRFAALMADAEPYLTTAEQLPWFARLEDKRDNIVAAMRYRCDIGDADGALRLALSVASGPRAILAASVSPSRCSITRKSRPS